MQSPVICSTKAQPLRTEGVCVSHGTAQENIEKNPFRIKAELFGEDIDIKRHGFKVEIKSPTFHEMEINEGEEIRLKYLLDL